MLLLYISLHTFEQESKEQGAWLDMCRCTRARMAMQPR